MSERQGPLIVSFAIFWCLLVLALFLHASGKVNLPFFHFPQPKGNLLLAVEGYKHYNFVGLREKLYAVPQGYQFIHPERREYMQKIHIFVAHGIEEAKRMVDAETQNIEDRLELQESNFLGFNLFSAKGKIYAVAAVDPQYGSPMPPGRPYNDVLVGQTIEEAKSFILANPSAMK